MFFLPSLMDRKSEAHKSFAKSISELLRVCTQIHPHAVHGYATWFPDSRVSSWSTAPWTYKVI